MLAGQPHQQLRPPGLQHGVDGGVIRARQLAERRVVVAQDITKRLHASAPRPGRSGGPTNVGVSKPANTSRQAASAASTISIGEPGDKAAVRGRRGQPLPVIAGEDLAQQDRQRPAVHHDVVEGQHEPVPVVCGADQRRPEGRPVGQIADRGTFLGAQPLDLLIEIDAVGVQLDIPPAGAGSAGMICTGSSNCGQNRAARFGCRSTTVRTASRSRWGSSGPLKVMSSCTAYTSSSPARCWRGRAVPAAAGSAAARRRSRCAGAARRSGVGSAGPARCPTGSARPRRRRTCAQMPASASNHNWLSRLTCVLIQGRRRPRPVGMQLRADLGVDGAGVESPRCASAASAPPPAAPVTDTPSGPIRHRSSAAASCAGAPSRPR